MLMEQPFIQLGLTELKPDVLASRMSECAATAPYYHLWQNQGAYPANRLSEITNLRNVMNTAPSGERDRAMLVSMRQRLTNTAATRWAAGARRRTSKRP